MSTTPKSDADWTLESLRVYQDLPEWTAQTLPKAFQKQHNTKEGSWARLRVLEGSLRFVSLDESGEVLGTTLVDPAAGPQLVLPGAWHRVEAESADLRCQLSFLCTPDRYMEKKYQLNAPHSEVRKALPQLQAAPGKTVLDLGSGQGRNSLFLAQAGFEVTAVDHSEASIAKLQGIAKAEALPVDAKTYNINEAQLASQLSKLADRSGGQVDHIISTVVFQFLDAERVPAILADMQAVTRPGGLHLIVAPVQSQALPCSLNFPFLFAEGQLREVYKDWELLHFEEEPGEFHRRDAEGNRYKAMFAVILARKPA